MQWRLDPDLYLTKADPHISHQLSCYWYSKEYGNNMTLLDVFFLQCRLWLFYSPSQKLPSLYIVMQEKIPTNILKNLTFLIPLVSFLHESCLIFIIIFFQKCQRWKQFVIHVVNIYLLVPYHRLLKCHHDILWSHCRIMQHKNKNVEWPRLPTLLIKVGEGSRGTGVTPTRNKKLSKLANKKKPPGKRAHENTPAGKESSKPPMRNESAENLPSENRAHETCYQRKESSLNLPPGKRARKTFIQ